MGADPFRIRDHVADFDDIVKDIRARSEASRKDIPMIADVAYGPDPTETVDLFFPHQRNVGMPVHIFIHGGYWRMFSKRDYSYVADTITSAGAIAVIVDYALMPTVRMATIVDQVRRAKQWVLERIAEHGGDPERVSVSGHSAGAHLSTFLFNQTERPSGIKTALLLGGLYDLKPLQSSFLHAEIAITDREVDEFTPMTHRHDPSTTAVLLVGADETPPFHQQADAFVAVLRRQGLSATYSDIEAGNHMSSVRDLGIPGSETAKWLDRAVVGT